MHLKYHNTNPNGEERRSVPSNGIKIKLSLKEWVWIIFCAIGIIGSAAFSWSDIIKSVGILKTETATAATTNTDQEARLNILETNAINTDEKLDNIYTEQQIFRAEQKTMSNVVSAIAGKMNIKVDP